MEKKDIIKIGKLIFEQLLEENKEKICKYWNDNIRNNIEDIGTIAGIIAGFLIKNGMIIESAIPLSVIIVKRGLNHICHDKE